MSLTGILCAVEAEAQPIIEKLVLRETVEKSSLSFLLGTLSGKEVVLVRSGMGKVNAAVAGQCMIDSFPIERLIISGVGGSLCQELRLFDVTVCEKCTHHDLPMDSITADYPKMEGSWFYTDKPLFELVCEENPGIKPASYLTGEKFIDNEGRTELVQRYGEQGAISADMETAAVAQACLASGIPFCCVRAVSDTEEERGFEVFWQNVTEASRLAADAVIKLIKKLP